MTTDTFRNIFVAWFRLPYWVQRIEFVSAVIWVLAVSPTCTLASLKSVKYHTFEQVLLSEHVPRKESIVIIKKYEYEFWHIYMVWGILNSYTLFLLW